MAAVQCPSSSEKKRVSVDAYIAEMRASREALLTKITSSSGEIGERCREAMGVAKAKVAELFEEEERERVVSAYAEKLRASREEIVAKLEARQRNDRDQLIEDLRRDVGDVVEAVVQKHRASQRGSGLQAALAEQRQTALDTFQRELDAFEIDDDHRLFDGVGGGDDDLHETRRRLDRDDDGADHFAHATSNGNGRR